MRPSSGGSSRMSNWLEPACAREAMATARPAMGTVAAAVPPLASDTGVARLRVTAPLAPPPLSPTPAVTPVIVPLAEGQLDVQAVLAHCRAHLADFKCPQYIALRDQPLPRNPGGKLLKAQLRDQTSWGEPVR